MSRASMRRSWRQRSRLTAMNAYGRLVIRNRVWDGRQAPARSARQEGRPGPDAVPFVLLGDSSALSVGVQSEEDSVAVVLARAFTDEYPGPVQVKVFARAGATTASMAAQVRAAIGMGRPGVAVVLIGANDVLAPSRLGRKAELLGAYIDTLQRSGWRTVVATCPDVGAPPALRHWARPIATLRSRRLAREQAAAALAAGAAVVSLTVPEFRNHAVELYCPDGFHPSAEGYALYLARVAVAVRVLGRAARSAGRIGVQAPAFVQQDQAAECVLTEPGASLFPVGEPAGSVLVCRFTGEDVHDCATAPVVRGGEVFVPLLN